MHPTQEVKYTCPEGHVDILNIDQLIVPLLSAIWKRGLHTNYSCQGDEDTCHIGMQVDNFKKFMEIIGHINDYTNEEEVEWYERVISYHITYRLAHHLNQILLDFPDDEEIHKCNIQIDVDVTVFIPHSDLNQIIHKLNTYQNSPMKTKMVHAHTLDDGDKYMILPKRK